MIVLNQFLPLALSWLTIGCLFEMVNKQTNKQSVSTSRSLRSNQAPLRNIDCHGGSRILTAELAHIFD